MKRILLAPFVVASLTLTAASPSAKLDPVAEGFPVWRGLGPKNYLMGRQITPSELRHRTTVVIEVSAGDDLNKQLLLAGDVAGLNPLGTTLLGENWEMRVLPRDTIFLLSVHAGDEKNLVETLKTAMKPPKGAGEAVSRGLSGLKKASLAVYSDVTFDGAPDAGGKYPFAYVMGPTGTNPVYRGTLTVATKKALRLAYKKTRKVMADMPWVPFFGTVAESRRPAALVKALEKGKTAKTCPLAAIQKSILKDVLSKDAEKATDAQIVYDAIDQARGDLALRICLEVDACPHRAAYDLQQLFKYWPAEKKNMDEVVAKLKTVPEANKLAQVFDRIMMWSDPNFTCKNAGEAKKIVQELNKVKKELEKFQNSKSATIQGGAQLLDSQVDELIAVIPTRIPEK